MNTEKAEKLEAAVTLNTRPDLFGHVQTTSGTVDRATLAKVLKRQLQHMTLEQFVGLITNPFNEIMEYAALVEGRPACKNTSLLFNPHRLDTVTHKHPVTVYRSLREIDTFASGFARAILFRRKSNPRGDIAAVFGMGVESIQYVNEFPPHVMRDLCRRYRLNTTSRVLDPCAGWGGRMIGASVVVGEYVACEPSTLTYTGLKKLYKYLKGFRPEFKVTLNHLPFEDYTPEGRFDFAMTSPPYYDTEHYSPEDSNSLNRYKSFEDWVEGFYLPLIDKTLAALRPGAPFVLNIGSRRYPLNDVLRDRRHKTVKITRLAEHYLQRSNNKKLEGETFYELRMK